MAANGKNSIHYTKKNLATSKGISVGFKKLKFYHEPTAGDTTIDLNALVLPGANIPPSATNPSAGDLTAAKLLTNKDNLTLISFQKGVLDFDDYTITSNSVITLKDATLAGEIFIGIVDHVAKTGLQVVDSSPVVLTATLTAGTDEVITGPYDLNKYPTTQQGALMVFLDGQLMMRNVGNATAAPGADGNYQEVGSNGLGSSIKFNTTSGLDRQVIIVSNGLAAALPNDSLLAQVESSQGQIDALIPTVAALAGVPETTFQTAPNSVDLLNFGQRLLDVETETDTNTADIAALPVYEEFTATLDSDFSAGTVRGTRIGSLVTLTVDNDFVLANSDNNHVSSALIPANFRPQTDVSSMVRLRRVATFRMSQITITAAGQFRMDHIDENFAAINTNTVDMSERGFTISYSLAT